MKLLTPAEIRALGRVNVLKILKDCLEHDFDRGRCKIGCSALPWCPRKTIIGHLRGYRFTGNPKTLHGTILHEAIQQPDVLAELLSQIMWFTDMVDKDLVVVPEKHLLEEIYEDHFLEGHVDVYTSRFLVEIKTTSTYMKYYNHEVLPYHAQQLNTYMGLTGVHLGFILSLNTRAFQSKIEDWDKLWKKYGFILPVTFSEDLYAKTLARAKEIFEHMENDDWDLEGPMYDWECKVCDPRIRFVCREEERVEKLSDEEIFAEM